MHLRITTAACLLALLLLHPALATPTWHSLGPGGGGWLPSVAVSPRDSRVVYLGCDVGGVFISTDAGVTWKVSNSGLHDYYIEAIAPHPRDPMIIYLGTQGGVHQSTDGGRTWRWLRTGFPPVEQYSFSAPISALAIDPVHPDTVYAGIGRPRWGDGGKGAVYRTRDAGAHWQLANPGGGGLDPQAIISDLIVHPRTTARLYAATDRGLYRSDDSGATWRPLTRGLPGTQVRHLALCPAHPDTMYLTLTHPPGHRPWQGGVFRSDDAGETWRPVQGGLPTQIGEAGQPTEMTSTPDHVVVHPTNSDIVYVGDASWVSAGIWRTRDGGKSWRQVTDSQNPRRMAYGWITFWGPAVEGLALDPRAPDTLYFSTSGHVFRTTDGGEHWQQRYTRPAPAPQGVPPRWSSTGLEITCLNDIVVHPRDPQHLYFCYYDIGLLQSLDGGRSFTQTVQGMHYAGNTFTVAFDPDDPKIVYAGTGEWASNHGDVCRSTDGGLTWIVVGKPETGLPDGQTHTLIVDRDSARAARRLYVTVAEAGVFCSEDGGASWQPRNEGLPAKSIRGLVKHPTMPATLLALVAGVIEDGGGLYRSDDRGLHWRRLSTTAWADPRRVALSRSDPNRLYLTARAAWSQEHGPSPGGVFASRDGGVSWAQVLDDKFMEALAVDPTDADVAYVGGTDHPFHDDAIGRGVLRSRDGGRTWEDLSADLPNHTISVLTLDPHHPGRLYASTGGNGAFVWEDPKAR